MPTLIKGSSFWSNKPSLITHFRQVARTIFSQLTIVLGSDSLDSLLYLLEVQMNSTSEILEQSLYTTFQQTALPKVC